MVTMATNEVLTLDAALALLQDYVDDLQLEQTLEFGSGLAGVSDTDECRFKRARQRRKQELKDWRTRVVELEERLQILKTQTIKRTEQRTEEWRIDRDDSRVWAAIAKCMRRERHEAEELNAQLKMMVDSTQRYSLWLQSLLLRPVTATPFFSQKQRYPCGNPLADMPVIKELLARLGNLRVSMGASLFASSSSGDTKSYRTFGCGLILEAVDIQILPCDIASASAIVWQYLAYEEGPQEAHVTIGDGIVVRLDLLNVLRDSTLMAYTNRFVRQRFEASDQVVILGVGLSQGVSSCRFSVGQPDTHETFAIEECVRIHRVQVGESHVCVVRTLRRLHRNSCGNAMCNAGGVSSPTISDIVDQLPSCIEGEMRDRAQAIEQRLHAWHARGAMVVA